MEKMWAARFYEANLPVKIEQMEVPPVSDDDVLVQIRASGICHSDLNIFHQRGSPRKIIPITLGHEGSGIVLQKGKNVRNVEIGDRVGIEYLISCGKCRYCRIGKENLCDNLQAMTSTVDGLWKEKTVVPSRNVHRLPTNIDFPEGAIMNCSVLTAYHAAKLAGVSVADTVVVYGLGGVGLSLVQWSRIFGAGEIIAIDLEEGKLESATHFGATSTINPKKVDPIQEVRRLTEGGVDIGFEVIGRTDTTRNTLACVRKAGKVCLVGMCYDNWQINTIYDLQFPELKIMSPSDHVQSEIPEVIRFIQTDRYKFGNIITHRLPLAEANKGIEILDKRIGNPGRIVLEP